MQDRILIVDFGSQVTQLIARRIREAGVYSEIVPFQSAEAALDWPGLKGIILSGGPASVHEGGSPRAPERVFSRGVPVLGICYGEQTMCAQLGGKVEASDNREFGKAFVEVKAACALFDGVWQPGERHQVWMSHGDRVTAIPEGFRVVAASEGAPFAAIADERRQFYATQFHMEVVHTPDGARLLANFALDICGCKGDWSMAHFRTEMIHKIRKQVGLERVICGLSGGVDSAVTAVLIHEAIGAQLTCIFVDHGLMRLNEADQVVRLFREAYNIPLVHVDASDMFLGALAGVSDPEQKRKIIGAEFISTFDAEAAKLGNEKFLVQGTLYSDVIESGGGTNAATIKSHHNVGGLPDDMEMELVEPLRQLFKDEVRLVGEELGQPERMVWRQPFPGPGLAIRIIGEVTAERLDILRQADFILQEEIRLAGLYRDLWQSFAVLPAVRSVGVQGDSRTYAYPIVIRAVTSDDAMTADWARLPYDLIEKISSRVINEVPGVNRVLLDVTSKPPGTIEWE
ncbi:MAG: glutamine-hydrolyzing GMP synthase [Aestuariivirga sp.]|uniref:glutamine-hydrolyzing GMP synthase n=1 Tax=Aestuariivirga sp. TaxID=2650926 RepID=UPI0038D18386